MVPSLAITKPFYEINIVTKRYLLVQLLVQENLETKQVVDKIEELPAKTCQKIKIKNK